MRITYRVLISLSASIGFAFLLISLLSLVNATRIKLAGKVPDGFWDTYLSSSSGYDAYAPHFFVAALLFLMLFYVFEIQKKSLRS